MLELKSPSDVNGLIRNFELIFKTKDITKLTKKAYAYLHVRSGFIAHYNWLGFVEYYKDEAGIYGLYDDIILNERNSMTNYRPEEKDYPYYKQQADIYAELIRIAKKYIPY